MIINHGNLAILNQSFSAAFAGGLAMAAPRLVRSAGLASVRETAWLDALGRAALRSEKPTDLNHNLTHHRALKAKAGAPLDPGSTLRFTLPTRDTEGAVPSLLLQRSEPLLACALLLRRARCPADAVCSRRPKKATCQPSL